METVVVKDEEFAIKVQGKDACTPDGKKLTVHYYISTRGRKTMDVFRLPEVEFAEMILEGEQKTVDGVTFRNEGKNSSK